MTIGIVPAAGKATRIYGLPKYLLPVPGGYLLERMVKRMDVPCYIGANNENYDLINAYKPATSTVYRVESRSMPETILAARQYAGDENVLMGMPDTYWTDGYVFQNLSDNLDDGAICAVAVFLVSAGMASRMGVCLRNSEGFLKSIEDKQQQTYPQWIWGAAAWQVTFWQYIQPEDAHMGIAFIRALSQGVNIPACFIGGDYYDNGTPDDYFRCIRELTEGIYAVE